MSKIRAHIITHSLSKKHGKDAFFTEVKNGSTWLSSNLLRLDAVAIKKSWRQPCITGYEVKVDRQDFLRDEKWPLYKDCCNRLYFACPTGLIERDELPDDIGLIYYNPEKESLYTKKKALFRNIDMPVDLLYYLIICRLDSDRHPFFSDRREKLKEWVEDKDDRVSLGREVSSKLIRQLHELKKESREHEIAKSRYEETEKRMKEIQQVLRDAGVRAGGYYGHEETINFLKQALNTKIPLTVINNLRQIKIEASRANEAIKKFGEKTG